MSDMRDALNKLARRGTPRGFEHVLAGAAASAARGSDDDDESPVPAGDLEPIPFVTAEPGARPRRPLGSMVAAAGVAALVLVGTFAVAAVVGNGGSGSAEGAVRRLADALSHEDPLAAADVLAPDEVRSLHGTLDAAARKAEELQLVQTAGAPLAGIDFNVDGVRLSTQSLGDGYSKVVVEAGTFSASTHKAQFSPLMQKVFRNSHDNHSESDLSQLAAAHHLPTFVVAVRRGGSWYVSAAYTVLEYIREWNDVSSADFGSGERAISTLGADSPDAAVQESMRALQRADWSKLMTLAPPGELPVYDYRAAITEIIRKDNAQSGSASQPKFTIDAMTTSAQVNGDTAKVTLKASGTTDSGKWSLDGGCFTPPGNATTAYPCGAGPIFLGLAATPLSSLDGGSQITVVRQDGRWFVSPVGTVLDQLNHFITQIDRRSLYTLLGVPNLLPPDGTLTLGQPVALGADADHRVRVLEFKAHKGESIIGAVKSAARSTTQPRFNRVTMAYLFAPDGSEIGGGGCCLLDGGPITIPADGTYIVVLENFDTADNGTTVTIWDTADAPPGTATQTAGNSGSGTCTLTPLGGESCSSATQVAPRATVGTVPGGGPPVATSGDQCTISGNVTTCVSPPTASSKSSSATSSVPHG
ncbi:MAG TPA: hypothetical protein VGP92_06580, partial [Acidimicrobiia bacterium]|nr:hypothetical protein [Acidimicrobiia bacterium]